MLLPGKEPTKGFRKKRGQTPPDPQPTLPWAQGPPPSPRPLSSLCIHSAAPVWREMPHNLSTWAHPAGPPPPPPGNLVNHGSKALRCSWGPSCASLVRKVDKCERPQIAAFPKPLPAPEPQGSAGSFPQLRGSRVARRPHQRAPAPWLWGAFLLELTGLSAGLPPSLREMDCTTLFLPRPKGLDRASQPPPPLPAAAPHPSMHPTSQAVSWAPVTLHCSHKGSCSGHLCFPSSWLFSG